MARKARRSGRRPTAQEPPLTGGWTREQDGWIVRSVSGAAATKAYRCPGCQQEIPPGTPHVVAWPVDEESARRHWHTHCFAVAT